MRHIYVSPILQLRHKPNRGAIRIFININLHYITANVVSFSLKQDGTPPIPSTIDVIGG